MRTCLADACRRAAHDDTVGAVLLCGAGEHFCVGGDVKEMAANPVAADNADAITENLRQDTEAVRWLDEMDKPSIAAVSGVAAGAGLALALACDLRFAGQSARFTTAFARIGLSVTMGEVGS